MKLSFLLAAAFLLSTVSCNETVDTLSDKKHEKAVFDQTELDRSTFGK